MTSFTWEQVGFWRLHQHHLITPAPSIQAAVSRLGCVQAQVMSATELAIGARVPQISSAEIQNALWQDRTLLKTWALRGTLHLLTFDDFPLYIGALRTVNHFWRASWLRYFGLTTEGLQAILAGVQVILSDEGLTREQLAHALAEYARNPKLSELLLSGWGSLLKPAAFQGYLCFGPSEGQKVTFMSPAKWAGDWQPMDSDEALKEFARRFLKVYAPATHGEFARWMGVEASRGKKVFKLLADEIQEVSVEGVKTFVLADCLPAMQAIQPQFVVRLLPLFDNYTIAASPHSRYFLEDAHRSKVYRSQGWISAVVVVNGRMAGVWDMDKKRSQNQITVTMFTPPSSEVQQGIEAEVQRIGQFLQTPTVLV